MYSSKVCAVLLRTVSTIYRECRVSVAACENACGGRRDAPSHNYPHPLRAPFTFTHAPRATHAPALLGSNAGPVRCTARQHCWPGGPALLTRSTSSAGQLDQQCSSARPALRAGATSTAAAIGPHCCRDRPALLPRSAPRASLRASLTRAVPSRAHYAGTTRRGSAGDRLLKCQPRLR